MSLTAAALLKTESMLFACSVMKFAPCIIINHLHVVPTQLFATSPTFLFEKLVKFDRPIQVTE